MPKSVIFYFLAFILAGAGVAALINPVWWSVLIGAVVGFVGAWGLGLWMFSGFKM